MCGTGCACYQDASQDVVCATIITTANCQQCNFDEDCTSNGQGFCVDACRCIGHTTNGLSCIYPGSCPNPPGLMRLKLRSEDLPTSEPRRRSNGPSRTVSGRRRAAF